MKVKKVLLMILVMICLLMNNVYADSTSLTITGEENAKTNEEKVLIVKLTSDENIGLVSGKISKNDEIKSIVVTGKNNWNLTYNESNGLFNIYKSEGAKDEEIMEIKYTSSNSDGTGKISLEELKVTNINYETKELEDISKNIVIKAEVVTPADDQQKPDNTTNKEENKVDPNKKPSVKPTTPEEPTTVVRVEGGETSKKDTTIANTNLPNTGINFIINNKYILVAIGCCSILAVFFVIKGLVVKNDLKKNNK